MRGDCCLGLVGCLCVVIERARLFLCFFDFVYVLNHYTHTHTHSSSTTNTTTKKQVRSPAG